MVTILLLFEQKYQIFEDTVKISTLKVHHTQFIKLSQDKKSLINTIAVS